MATIDVDVELEMFDQDEIIDYIISDIRRHDISDSNLIRLKRVLAMSSSESFNVENLADLRKLEFLEEIFNKYTVEQLEEKLK